jgi:predicted nucleic acid-binding protein
MTKYILDTNIISYLWDDSSPYHHKIVEKLNALNDEDIIATSIINIYELNYGVKSFTDEKLKTIFENALYTFENDEDFHLYSLDINSADYFSDLKLNYKTFTGIDKKSAKKNDLDFMIASIALGQNAILVSNDKIFDSISKIEPSLKFENWIL